MFPSLIGSLKTTYGPIGYNSETGFPSLIGSLKTLHAPRYAEGLRPVSIPHRKFKNEQVQVELCRIFSVSIPHRKFKNA